MEVGRLTARLDAIFDDDNFDKFDRRLKNTRQDASRNVVAELKADADTRQIDKYDRSLKGVDDTSKRASRSHGAMGAAFKGSAMAFGAGAVGLGLLTKGVLSSVDAFQESEKVSRRQSLVIKTMGGDAGASAKHIDALASSMMRKTGIDDDAIISTTNVIRTFRNIRNEAGEGSKIFDRTTKATLDMASAFGMDTQSAAIQLGKALNDPAKGAAALSRTGAIAKADLEKLKQMAEDGVPILEQQKFVLKAVEEQVKGTAASNATATSKMKASFGELQEAIGRQFAPVVDRVAKRTGNFIDQMSKGVGAGGRFGDKMRDVARDVTRFVTGMMKGTGAGGRFVDKVEELGGKAKEVFANIHSVVKPIVSFFVNHPKYIGIAITAYAAYKLAATAAAVHAKLALLSPFKGPALAAQTAAATAAGSAAGGGFGKKAAGIGMKALRFAGWAGVGVMIGDMLGLKVSERLADALDDAKDFVIKQPEVKLANPGGLKKIIEDQIAGNKRLAQAYKDLDRARPKLGPLNTEISLQKREIAGLVGRMVDLDRGTKAYKQSADRLKDAQANLNAKLGVRGAAQDVAELRSRLGKLDKGSDEYRTTARRLLDAQDKLNRKLRDAEAAGKKGEDGIRRIGGGATSAAGAVRGASSNIWGNVKGLADSLGGSVPQFTPHTLTQVGPANYAGGGWIGSRGQAGRDEVPAMLGRGEAVLNRHQQGVIEGLLGTGFLDSLFSRVKKPHYLAEGGRIPDVRIDGPAGGYRNASNGATSLMDRIAEKFAAKLAPKWEGGSTAAFTDKLIKAAGGGLSRGSGYRSPAENARVGGSPTSDHMNGTPANPGAWDVPVNSPNAIGSKLAELGRKAGISQVLWEVPDHFDHVHLGYFAKGGWVKPSNAKFQSGRGMGKKAGKVIAGFEQQLADMERIYGQDQRSRAMNDKDYIVENEDGTTKIHQGNLDDQTDDLTALKNQRALIRAKIGEYKRKAIRAAQMYATARKRIKQAMDAIPDKIKGKGKRADQLRALASKRRGRYSAMFEDYGSRKKELEDKAHDLGFDWTDANLDVKELKREIAALDPKKISLDTEADPSDAAPVESTPDAPAGDAPSSDAPLDTPATSDPAPEAAPAPPSAEEIARGVAETFAQFNANRQDLFASFGANFSQSPMMGDASERAAGLRNFGAFGNEEGGVAGAGGGVTVINNYKTQPEDPHTWSHNLDFELRTAL